MRISDKREVGWGSRLATMIARSWWTLELEATQAHAAEVRRPVRGAWQRFCRG